MNEASTLCQCWVGTRQLLISCTLLIFSNKWCFVLSLLHTMLVTLNVQYVVVMEKMYYVPKRKVHLMNN